MQIPVDHEGHQVMCGSVREVGRYLQSVHLVKNELVLVQSF